MPWHLISNTNSLRYEDKCTPTLGLEFLWPVKWSDPWWCQFFFLLFHCFCAVRLWVKIPKAQRKIILLPASCYKLNSLIVSMIIIGTLWAQIMLQFLEISSNNYARWIDVSILAQILILEIIILFGPKQWTLYWCSHILGFVHFQFCIWTRSTDRFYHSNLLPSDVIFSHSIYSFHECDNFSQKCQAKPSRHIRIDVRMYR